MAVTSVRAPRRPRSPLADGVWRVAEILASPLVPADYLDMFDPLRSGADLRGRIVQIRPETADAVTLVIAPGKDWAGHVPGQYIRMGIDINGVRHWRAYSLTHRTDAPDGHISVTVKAIDDGVVSTYLVREAQAGALVMLDQATGDFTIADRAPRASAADGGATKILFLSAGSGITPIMGMIRNHVATGQLTDVVHVHAAPGPQDVIFGDELRQYADRGLMRLHEHHDGGVRFLDLAGDLDDLVPDWRDRQVWTCGPSGLLDAAEAHWETAGLAHQLHTERFRPTVLEPGDGGEITFLASDVTVDADGATPILDAGEDAGLLMPSGCRMGICFGCVVTMQQGAVRDLRTGEITTAEPGDELPIQTCINAVAGSCDLEI